MCIRDRVVIVWDVDMFTTDGINLSAKSAKEFGADLAVFNNIKFVNTKNIRSF